MVVVRLGRLGVVH